MPRKMVWSVACRENSNIPARTFSRIAAVMCPGCRLAIVALLQNPARGEPTLHQDGREVGLGHIISEGAVAEYYRRITGRLKLGMPVAASRHALPKWFDFVVSSKTAVVLPLPCTERRTARAGPGGALRRIFCCTTTYRRTTPRWERPARAVPHHVVRDRSAPRERRCRLVPPRHRTAWRLRTRAPARRGRCRRGPRISPCASLRLALVSTRWALSAMCRSGPPSCHPGRRGARPALLLCFVAIA